MNPINKEILRQVLSKKIGEKIISVDFKIKQLQGGTVGDVKLITCTVKTVEGAELPSEIVLKTQKKWERNGDPDSWRREYDFYKSNFESIFSDSFRLPKCYHAEMNEEENETQIWMEHIDGISGLDLNVDMYEKAALEIGRFQGKLYSESSVFLESLTNLSHADLMKNSYLNYRSWPIVYDYIRSEDCVLPVHLRQMIIDIDEQSEEIFSRIEKLPLVLCHRDFWITNLIYDDGNFAVIDWDTSGLGYLGEDMASLIADESNIDYMVEYYQRCIPAYYKGFNEYSDKSKINDHCVYEMILIVFGYRSIEWYLHTQSDEERENIVNTLQKIYEMKNSLKI